MRKHSNKKTIMSGHQVARRRRRGTRRRPRTPGQPAQELPASRSGLAWVVAVPENRRLGPGGGARPEVRPVRGGCFVGSCAPAGSPPPRGERGRARRRRRRRWGWPCRDGDTQTGASEEALLVFRPVPSPRTALARAAAPEPTASDQCLAWVVAVHETDAPDPAGARDCTSVQSAEAVSSGRAFPPGRSVPGGRASRRHTPPPPGDVPPPGAPRHAGLSNVRRFETGSQQIFSRVAQFGGQEPTAHAADDMGPSRPCSDTAATR